MVIFLKSVQKIIRIQNVSGTSHREIKTHCMFNNFFP